MRMVLSRFRRSQETIIKWSRFTFLMFSPDHLAAVIDDIIEMQHPRDLLFEPQATMADRLRNLFNAIAEHQGDWIAVLYESDFRNSVQGKKGTIYGTIGCYTDFFLDPITDDNSDVVGEELELDVAQEYNNVIIEGGCLNTWQVRLTGTFFDYDFRTRRVGESSRSETLSDSLLGETGVLAALLSLARTNGTAFFSQMHKLPVKIGFPQYGGDFVRETFANDLTLAFGEEAALLMGDHFGARLDPELTMNRRFFTHEVRNERSHYRQSRNAAKKAGTDLLRSYL
jgi:hypothetical protein